jgi:hypothetical protein
MPTGLKEKGSDRVDLRPKIAVLSPLFAARSRKTSLHQ